MHGTLLQAPSSGTWAVAPGAMAEARANAAAAALPDGSVLVTGGDGLAGSPLASAELFSLDGSFASLAPMSFPRSRHVAVALKDGRVLVAGGNGADGNASNSAEIFDPNSGAWQAAGAMLEPRAGATATRLSDGKVLIAGGENNGAASMTLELFDPASDSFVPAGVMSSARQDHAAALLAGNATLETADKVLLAGGSDGTAALASTEIWDAASGAVVPGPSLSVARSGLSATTLLDGSVLLAGGAGASGELGLTEVFDPASGLLELASSQLGSPRQKHLAIFLPHNSAVLFVGGTAGGAAVSAAELYMPWAGGFVPTGQPAAARADAAASTASDGMLVVAGGKDTAGALSNSAEVYGFATLKTDKDDYAPGEIVTITGGGWEAGDDVILTLHEINPPEPHPDRIWIVTADANGNLFDNSFSPEEHHLGVRFYLTAEGARSQAMITFTDSQPTSVSLSPASQTVAPGGSAVYTTTVVKGGNNNACSITLSVTTALPAGAAASFDLPNPFTMTTANVVKTLTITTTLATPPGTYPFTVAAARGAGCQGSGSETTAGTLIVDNTAPTVTINQAAGQADPTNGGTINFTAVFSEPVSNFATGDVMLGGSAGATTAIVTGGPTTYNVAVSGMTTTGTVTASIPAGVAQDAATNLNTASTSTDNTVTYDNAAPAPPSTPDLDAASDSGSSNSDDITNDTTPTFTGTAEAGATVRILVDGIERGNGVATGGVYSITTVALTQGTKSVTATATDSSGNVSSPSGALSVTIDTTADAPSAPDLDAASDSGSSTTDNNTNDNTPTFSGTAEPNASVEVFRAGSISLGATTANGSGNWSLTVAGALADATHSITAKQTDVAGNVSAASGALSLVIDTVAPAPPSVPNLNAADDSGQSDSDNLTNQTTNLTFMGTDTTGSLVELFEGASLLGSDTAVGGPGNWNINAVGPFSEGPHLFTATATDTAGNTSDPSGALTVNIDTTAPTVTINQAAGQADPANVGPINFTAIFSEDVFGFATGDVSLAGSTTGGVLVGAVSGGPSTFSVSVSGMAAAGNVVASIPAAVATDAAGNNNAASTSTDNLVYYNPDTAPPVVTVTFAAPDGANGWFVHSPVMGTVSADDTTTGNSNISAFTCTVDAIPIEIVGLSLGGPVAGGTISVSGEGVHSVACTSTDSAGNSNPAPTTATVKIDTVKPTASADATPAPNGNGWNNSDVTVTFTGSDATSGLAACDPAAVLSSEGAGQSASGSCTDNAGNVSDPSTASGINIDKTKPIISGDRAPAANIHGWNNTDVSVSFTCSDALSGVDSDSVAGATLTGEGAGQSVTNTGSCTDKAGNTADTATVSDINIDKTAPSVTGTPSRAADHNGWYTSAFSVDWNGTDGLSGTDTCDADSNYSGPDTASGSLTGHCQDKAGNDGSANFTFKFDATGPTAALSVTAGTPGTNGWYTSDVTVHTAGEDDVSGPVTCTADQYQTTETTGATFSGSCTNDAGLTTDADPLTVKLDKTAPTGVALSVTAGTFGDNGWYVTDVTIHTAGSEDISTPIACTPDQQQLADTTGTDFNGECTNDAGLTAHADALSIKRDATAPVVTASPDRAPDSNGWYNHLLTVSFSGDDPTSGVASCDPDVPYSGPDTASHSISGHCKDNAGNEGTGSYDFKYDATAPSISAALDRAAAGTGWFNIATGAPVLNFTCSDNLSGLADACPSPYTFPDGADQSQSRTIHDLAGNSASAGVEHINVDTVKPTISIAAPINALSPAYILNASVAASYSCSDPAPGSGISTCAGPVASGANFSTNPVGTHTFTVSAEDVAGNAADSVTHTYKVEYASGGMCLGSPGHAILQPIDWQGTSVFKQKSTVPAKFRVCDANGVSIGTAGVVQDFKIIGTWSGTVLPYVTEADVPSTTPDQYFRWSSTDQQWIFNINTKGAPVNQPNVTYVFRITLNDGSVIDFRFGLK
jgi:hypothetical protein